MYSLGSWQNILLSSQLCTPTRLILRGTARTMTSTAAPETLASFDNAAPPANFAQITGSRFSLFDVISGKLSQSSTLNNVAQCLAYVSPKTELVRSNALI